MLLFNAVRDVSPGLDFHREGLTARGPAEIGDHKRLGAKGKRDAINSEIRCPESEAFTSAWPQGTEPAGIIVVWSAHLYFDVAEL